MEPNIATPMMEQYLSLKQEHQDEVLFFRLGDFYEMFLDDAKEVSQILNITLTSRNGVPMCGIPYHAATGYIKRLLDAGKKVAICEQTEMPGQGRSIAKREVVQIISPGTAVEEEFLDETKTSYLLAISFHKEAIYCAYSDVSSGVLHLVDLPYEKKLEALYSLVEQLQPNELLLNEEDYFSFALFAAFVDEQSMAKTRLPAWYFSQSQGLSLLSSHMGTLNLKQFGLQDDSLLLEAAGALFRYLQHTAKNSLIHLQTLTLVEQNDYLLIDEASRKNLELLHNLQDGSEQRTLYSALNKTTTRGGSRLLKEWIASPLASLAAITHRQQWVEWFFEQNDERGRVRSLLAKVRDVNRLATRVSMNRSQPQDLVAIANAIQCFFELTEVHQERYLSLLGFHVESKNMENIVDLMDLIFRSINSEVRGSYEIGNVITTGFNSELDAKRSLAQKGFDAVGEYVEKLKQETGINAIKTGQNKIIGYYVEISKLHSKAVPPFLFRKQTLVNAERYTTEELSLLEQEINSATDQAAQLERKLYDQIVESCKEHTATLLSLGLFFSTLDVLQSLAHVAHSEHYCKPLMVEEDVLVIEEGRHPVVEQHLKRGEFVANSIDLTATDRRFCLITGPNMAGKSTYLRQTALIVLMAHLGAFVPATSATIGIVDRLYCRVGASDNLARGESTFLIEMQEAGYILRTATSRSLAIMDELGRGTSTQDGMSIAYAVMRAMIEMNVKTLFATHYHELTMLDTSGMQLLTLEVTETKRSILFLRKVKEGSAPSSYGLHVARMAGLPQHVIAEASAFQKHHFADYALKGDLLQLDLFTGSVAEHALVADDLYDELAKRIRSYPLDEMTPLQAMQFLGELQEELEKQI